MDQSWQPNAQNTAAVHKQQKNAHRECTIDKYITNLGCATPVHEKMGRVGKKWSGLDNNRIGVTAQTKLPKSQNSKIS